MQPTQGKILGHLALATRQDSATGSDRTPLLKATLSRPRDAADLPNAQEQTQRVRQNETKEYVANEKTRQSLRKNKNLNKMEINDLPGKRV